jgi:L-rhamnose mutarotase
VLDVIKDCNIRHYSINQRDGYLFSFHEYVGEDYEAGMAKMAVDPATQRWREFCERCREPLQTRVEGEWWAKVGESFIWAEYDDLSPHDACGSHDYDLIGHGEIEPDGPLPSVDQLSAAFCELRELSWLVC